MKQIIIYIFLFILAVASVIVIRLNDVPEADKAITIEQYYSIVDPFQHLDVPLYLTNDQHVLTDKEAYHTLYLNNDDMSKKINVSLYQISVDGTETYLSENYTKYILEINLPVIEDDVWISDCYLNITLSNDLHYTFKIGMFSYMNINQDSNMMFWTSLEAKKDNDVDIARVKQILVSFDSLSNEIEDIKLGLNQPVSFTMTDNLLLIDVQYQDYLLYGCPIVLYDQYQNTQIIDYFCYLRVNNMLQTSGILNHVYDVSYTT